MSLYPGGRKPVTSGGTTTYVASVEDVALAHSLAQSIEREFEALFLAVQGHAVPEVARQERRILFTAIARGILGFLGNATPGMARTTPLATLPSGSLPALEVRMDVNLDHP